jgi:hypothetical protein
MANEVLLARRRRSKVSAEAKDETLLVSSATATGAADDMPFKRGLQFRAPVKH